MKYQLLTSIQFASKLGQNFSFHPCDHGPISRDKVEHKFLWSWEEFTPREKSRGESFNWNSGKFCQVRFYPELLSREIDPICWKYSDPRVPFIPRIIKKIFIDIKKVQPPSILFRIQQPMFKWLLQWCHAPKAKGRGGGIDERWLCQKMLNTLPILS